MCHDGAESCSEPSLLPYMLCCAEPMGKTTVAPDGAGNYRWIAAFLSKNRLSIVLLAIAFLVRFIYLVAYSGSPFFQVHIADALYHEQWARQILGGDIFSRKMPWTLYKPPLYPYFIALGYLLSGTSNFLPMLLQVVMAAFSCVLIFLIGKKYFSTPAAFIGALVYNFYFPSVYFSTEMEVSTLAIFLTLLSFYLLIGSQSKRRLVGSACTFGFSILTLPTNVLLLPLYVFMLVRTEWSTKPKRHRWAYFCALVLLGISPGFLRNLSTGNPLSFISANGGINLYIGNNQKYDETVYLQPGYAFEDFYDEPRRVGGVTSFPDRDRYWYEKAFAFVRKQPGREMVLLLKKVALYFADYEIYRNTDIYYAKAHSIYRHIPFVPASLILATGLIGLHLAIRKRKDWELAAFCILQALPCVVFFVTDRYRLPSMSIWALFSGFFATSLASAIKAKNWPLSSGALAAALGIAVVSKLNLFVVKNPAYRPHLNLGFIYETQAKHDLSIKEYATALTLVEVTRPRHAKIESELHCRLGNAYLNSGDLPRALSNFNEAVALDPNSGPAYSYLGTFYDRKGRGDLAVEMFNRAIEINPWDTVSIHNLALFYLNAGQFDEAVARLKRVIELVPEDSGAHSDLAYAYGQLGKYTLMEHEAETALHYDPDSSASRYALAFAYLNTGRSEAAITEYRQITESSPRESSNAHNQLGVICAQQGDLNQAIDHWRKALEIDPKNSSAQANLQRARLMLP